jgi:hypothetical protein
MDQYFVEMLSVGGKSNSLGKVDEVIKLVLSDRSRLGELYDCLFFDDAWVRMRAADAFEKICRQHPDWLLPYIDRFPEGLAKSNQPSIQWHLAQIYRQVDLTTEQKSFAIYWLKQLLSTKEVDWIVAANAMDTLAQFTEDGSVSENELVALLKIQQQHKSKAVVKRANKLLEKLGSL